MVKCWVNTAKRFDRGTEVKPGVFHSVLCWKSTALEKNYRRYTSVLCQSFGLMTHIALSACKTRNKGNILSCLDNSIGNVDHNFFNWKQSLSSQESIVWWWSLIHIGHVSQSRWSSDVWSLMNLWGVYPSFKASHIPFTLWATNTVNLAVFIRTVVGSYSQTRSFVFQTCARNRIKLPKRRSLSQPLFPFVPS